MPIYTVREVVSKADKASVALEKRGLNAKSVTMTSLDPLALPDYPQIAYNLYKTLLPAFMLATKLGQTLPTTRSGYKIQDTMDNVIPVALPPIVVRFTHELSDEEVEEIKRRGGGVIAGKKKQMYTFGANRVDRDLMMFLTKHAKKSESTNPTTQGATNLSGIREFLRLASIITWFLKTQSYPAYSGPIANDDNDGGQYDSIPGLISAKRKGAFGLRNAKRARQDAEDVEMSDEEYDEAMADIGELTIGDGEDHIPKAKPSTAPEYIWGEATTMPTLPGLVFPFFDEMLEYDMNFVPSIIQRYFLDALGDTRDEILSNYNGLKGAHGTFARTTSGLILQHLFLGVKLAIESQARLYPVITSGRYTGFTLHGWYFTVSLDGYKHRPLMHEKLVAEVRKIDEHNIAIAEIMMRLKKLKLVETRRAPAQAMLKEATEECRKNPRALAALIRRFDVDEGEREEIEKLAGRLSFPQRYLEFSTENILKAIDLLLAREFPADDLPMYPRGGTLTVKSPILAIFALFGNEGFSFLTPNGRSVAIPSSIADDTLYRPYRGKNGKVTTPNPTIVLAKKSIGICNEDWEELLVTRRILLKTTRDQAFRCIAFGGDKGKKFWHAIIDRIGVLAGADLAKDVNADSVELGEDAVSETGDDLEDFL